MSDRRMALALAAFLAASPATAQEPWSASFWNPKPLADDLVLPLPCGGAMAFRPVATPLGPGSLADRQVTLGQADAETNYNEYLHQAFVAGPFRGGDGPPRYFLAKYEVTRDQYDAVTSGTCPQPSVAGRQPRADLAWVEAVAFTARLSTWLARNARDALPRVQEARAYVRLPTEEEWEYAARGGAAVSEADFAARTPPMPEGLQRYAWFQGTRSADGRARPVGLRDPNPLGFFDMLGNVAEWVLEPYRLNKLGRAHGQPGGMVARGGDFMTAEGQIRSSLRLELPPVDQQGEPLRLPQVGFRPALGLVATTSDARPAEWRAAFERESQSRSDASEDPARLLQVLRRDTADPALQQGIDRVDAALRSGVRERREQESQAIRSQIAAAAQIGRQVVQTLAYNDVLAAIVRFQNEQLALQSQLRGVQDQLIPVAPAAMRNVMTQQGQGMTLLSTRIAQTREAQQNQMREQEDRVAQMVQGYLRVVLSLGRGTDRQRIAEEGQVVLQEFQAERQGLLPELAQLAIGQISATAAGNPPGAEQVLRDLKALRGAPR